MTNSWNKAHHILNLWNSCHPQCCQAWWEILSGVKAASSFLLYWIYSRSPIPSFMSQAMLYAPLWHVQWWSSGLTQLLLVAEWEPFNRLSRDMGGKSSIGGITSHLTAPGRQNQCWNASPAHHGPLHSYIIYQHIKRFQLIAALTLFIYYLTIWEAQHDKNFPKQIFRKWKYLLPTWIKMATHEGVC